MVFNLFNLFSPKRDNSVTIRRTVSGSTVEKIKSDWRVIETLIAGKQPSQLKQALIMADKSLDNTLKGMVAGETMGERLKNSMNFFEPKLYNQIWSVHKMRNAFVHESGYEPPSHMVIKGLDTFKKALNHLGIPV